MIFMLGAAGSGMRNLAYLLQARGEEVAGADSDTVSLRAQFTGSDFTAVAEDEAGPYLGLAERVIYSDAIPVNHALLARARRSGAIVQRYSQAVAWLAQQHTLVAVAGTHGKSSTTAMLGHILVDSGFDPTVLIGAPVAGWPGGGARSGRGGLLIVEADEYRDHFLDFRPGHAAITSIDWDHPDYFASLMAVEHSFAAFLNAVQAGGTVVTLPAVKEAHAQLPWPAGTVIAPPLPKHIQLPGLGQHMRDNAAVAVALAQALDVPPKAAANALSTFPGVGRRFETLGTRRGMRIISDYGHHPSAIAATLAAARQLFPQQPVAVLLEIHTAERLIRFRSGFADALEAADGVVLVPVFVPAGREQTAQELFELLERLRADLLRHGKPTTVVRSFDELPGAVDVLAQKFAIAVAFTAGKLDHHLRKLLAV